MHKNSRIKSDREAIAISLVMAFAVLVASIFMLDMIRRKYGFVGFENLKMFLIYLLILEILFVLIWINRIKGVGSILERHLILSSLERSLISADVVEFMIGCIAVLPEISLDMDLQVITIALNNVQVRKRIEAVQDILSTALPERYTAPSSSTGSSLP